jgi:serine/threonine protein kinase/tetratricopeptide (TPR) repeat protein
VKWDQLDAPSFLSLVIEMNVLSALSKYRIIEKLGAGGMGEVYKAEDPALLRTVAIKVMSKQGERSADAAIRFLREARAASAFNHPNIVTIYEIGETGEHTYIVMEYVEGRSLRDLIKTSEVKPDKVILITLQICDALAEAHSRGIIHRDIKPENILLTDRGRVKLVDFGLAKTVSNQSRGLGITAAQSLTDSGTVMGTLSYMSPEQLRGEQLDERTDIFSFGIVLYEMITGELPFPGANSFEVAASILKDPAFEIGTVPEPLPLGIKDVVARLLEKRRRDRFASFVEVKIAVESLAQDSLPSSAGDLRPTISLPVAASAHRSASLAAAMRSFSKAVAAPPTILVLPLQSVGSDERSSYIGIGLAHAITTDLAKIQGLSVLSKSAGAGRIDEAGHGVRQLARELGATILLEGEVMRAGEIIGVMARLTDAEAGRVIWGSQYRGDAADLFSIQDAVCESVAEALKLSISSEVRDQIARPATTNIDAFEFYSRGRAFLERRDVRENIDFAVQMFEEALRLDADFALAYSGLGEAYWQKYQITHDSAWVDGAISACDRALVLDPNQAQVHVSLGIVYYGTGKIDSAIEEFEVATELQPMSDDAHKWLGRCWQRKGDMEKAVTCLERAIQIRPGYWENYNRLGICLYFFGRYRDAAEQFRKVITIQPDSYLGYNKLGGIYNLLGLYEDAVTMHRRAIEIYANSSSYTNLGTDYFHLKRYEEAIAAYRAAIELDPRDDVLYRNVGDAYLRVGRGEDATPQFETAIGLLSELLQVDPNDAEKLGRLAICQAKLGKRQDALESIGRATALEPHNTLFMYQRAVVHALTGRPDEAVESLSNALSHGYSRAEAQRDPDLESMRDRPDYKALFVPAG